MAMAARLGLCSLLAFALIGACSTEHVSDGEQSCTPGDEQPCQCGDEDGVQICNTQGSGYSACDCSGGTGGSGGGGGSAGSDADGSAGTAGSAGSDSDAAPPETDGGETDGGETTDAAPQRDALAPPSADAGGTACEGGGACLDCIATSCCDQFNACVEPDTCAAVGAAPDGGVGFSEFECMDICLLDIVDAGGTVGTTELDDCASACAETGNSVSAVTRALFECMVGDCNTGCY